MRAFWILSTSLQTDVRSDVGIKDDLSLHAEGM